MPHINLEFDSREQRTLRRARREGRKHRKQAARALRRFAKRLYPSPCDGDAPDLDVYAERFPPEVGFWIRRASDMTSAERTRRFLMAVYRGGWRTSL